MDDYRFLVKCGNCSWTRKTNGIQSDLKDLTEVVKCSNCGGPRQFKCPKCGMIAKQFRVRGNT